MTLSLILGQMAEPKTRQDQENIYKPGYRTSVLSNAGGEGS